MKQAKFNTRPGTFDEWIVNEIFAHDAYGQLLIEPDDRVLDVGANIGVFAVWAAMRGAEVYAIEPHPENLRRLYGNLELNELADQVGMISAAVTDGSSETVAFYITTGRNQGLHSIVERPCTERIMHVKAIGLQALIDTVQPDAIKIDIEGGEWEAVRSVTDWGPCRQIIMEFHDEVIRSLGVVDGQLQMVTMLEERFDTVTATPERNQVSMIYGASA